MDVTPIKTPMVVKSLFPNYIWDIPSVENTLYLTFDDGPTPEITRWTLNILKQYNAKATFFCIGKNIEQHPQVFLNIIKEGHAIGNHTQHHLNGWSTSNKKYLNNVEEAQITINNHIQNSEFVNHDSKIVNFFRPPYGKLTPKQGKELQKLGYKIILWDILSFDWDASVSNKTCLDNVVSKAKSGSIIVFHDSEKAKERLQYALPKVLDYFRNKGFKFKAIRINSSK